MVKSLGAAEEMTGGASITQIGTIAAGSGKIIYNYTEGSENLITDAKATVGTLEIANASGVQASIGTLTIGSELILTNGLMTTTSTNILELSSTATISST